MRRLKTAALIPLLLGGCSPVYVYKSWRGHARLLSRQRPAAEALADPAVPESAKAKLRLVGEIRAFAFGPLGLKRSENYTAYVEIPGPNVTVTVTASKKTALEAYEWWFPVLGRVPYKGFFDPADALKEQAALDRRGLDTYVSGVRAYSTLGWSRDPILSTMLDDPPAELAEVLLHELAHGTVFFKGQVDFNEALATFIGERGAAEFITIRFGADSAQARGIPDSRRRDEDFASRLDALYAELEALYASPLSDAEKLERREAVFAAAAPGLGLAKLNNAVVLAHRRYRYDLDDFARALDAAGGRWPDFLKLIAGLDPKRPRQALRERLTAKKL